MVESVDVLEIQDETKPEWTRFPRDDHTAWRVIIYFGTEPAGVALWLARGEYHKTSRRVFLIGRVRGLPAWGGDQVRLNKTK